MWSGASTASIDGGSIGPGCGGGPARRRASRTAAGMAASRSATPKSSLRSTSVQTSWCTLTREKAPRREGPVLAQPLVVGERVALQVGVEQQRGVRVALARLAPDRRPHQPVRGRPPQRCRAQARWYDAVPGPASVVVRGTVPIVGPHDALSSAPAAGSPAPCAPPSRPAGPSPPTRPGSATPTSTAGPGWAPQISGVRAPRRRLEPGLTRDRPRGGGACACPSRCSPSTRPPGRGRGACGSGPVRLLLHHGVEPDGDGTRTWLRHRGPGPRRRAVHAGGVRRAARARRSARAGARWADRWAVTLATGPCAGPDVRHPPAGRGPRRSPRRSGRRSTPRTSSCTPATGSSPRSSTCSRHARRASSRAGATTTATRCAPGCRRSPGPTSAGCGSSVTARDRRRPWPREALRRLVRSGLGRPGRRPRLRPQPRALGLHDARRAAAAQPRLADRSAPPAVLPRS